MEESITSNGFELCLIDTPLPMPLVFSPVFISLHRYVDNKSIHVPTSYPELLWHSTTL